MRVTEYKCTKHKIVNVERHCSNCGNSWTSALRAEGSATASTEKEAGRKARDELDYAVTAMKKNVEDQVLCSLCGHFAEEAMKKHFRKGFRIGLRKKFLAGARDELAKAIASFIGVVFCGLIVIFALSPEFESEYSIPCAVIFGAIGVAAAGFAVYKLMLYISLLMRYPQVARMIQEYKDEDLLPLVVECYQAEGQTLSADKKWADTLLAHTLKDGDMQ